MHALCPILISLHYLAIIMANADILLSIIYQAAHLCYLTHLCYFTHRSPPKNISKECVQYASVLVMTWLGIGPYFFLSDSNKISALAVAICFFLFFKNWKLKYNRIINKIASSTFGVLCIHANSGTMRQWLWSDVCNNAVFLHPPILWFMLWVLS